MWLARVVEEWASAWRSPMEVKTKESGLELEDSGVPLDMVDGEIGPAGARWKAIPSRVTEGDIALVEAALAAPLPRLFRIYLRSRHHLVGELPGRPALLWSELPSDAPLHPLSTLIRGNTPLVKAGYGPFARFDEGDGVLSFDLKTRTEDDDCPVVAHDIDQLMSTFDDLDAIRRADLESFATPIYPSFRALLRDRSRA
jgi:hypothetical protein